MDRAKFLDFGLGRAGGDECRIVLRLVACTGLQVALSAGLDLDRLFLRAQISSR